MRGTSERAVLSGAHLTVGFGDHVVLDNLNLEVLRGESRFVGASGTGKSVLMRTVLRLLPKRSGTIEILGADYDKMGEAERIALDMRLGVLSSTARFFSALTVRENIQVPMREYLDLPQDLMDELARLKIELVGLATGGRGEIPLGAFRRHDQARGACARACARSRSRLSR